MSPRKAPDVRLMKLLTPLIRVVVIVKGSRMERCCRRTWTRMALLTVIPGWRTPPLRRALLPAAPKVTCLKADKHRPSPTSSQCQAWIRWARSASGRSAPTSSAASSRAWPASGSRRARSRKRRSRSPTRTTNKCPNTHQCPRSGRIPRKSTTSTSRWRIRAWTTTRTRRGRRSRCAARSRRRFRKCRPKSWAQV